ncbi:hypothetical protein V2J09_010625, partial [Rumex salicifolius]
TKCKILQGQKREYGIQSHSQNNNRFAEFNSNSLAKLLSDAWDSLPSSTRSSPMAMPSLSFLPATSFSLSSPRRLPSLVVACSSRVRKARVSRKAMSDADLYKGLREFVSSVGFPEDHVPSTKELAENGRKDLSNIVRRRGYKAVRDLLANSVCLTEGMNSPLHFEDDATGEEKKMKDLTQETSKQDRFEDDFGHNLWLNDAEGSREYKENSTVFNSAIHKRDSSVTRDKMETLVLNGAAVRSNEIAKPVPERNNTRNKDATHESRAGSGLSRDVNLEVDCIENQDEFERLKDILQQKELELCQLKELFEKEEQALFTLQSEAEEEIKTAQKLLSEMESELLAAEGSLAGLKEVQIEYMEEAQTVDIAGSFNGWYQPIKMDPHLDTDKDPTKSRNPRLWNITLWLYPGEYEVKFIVDGEWKVDPTREITTSNGLQNNILRVDG